jgi:hypothetical protein
MKNNQTGQSTIEFIFSFIFAVSLILLVFNTSLNYASGYVAHYATFMASRVFMTQDANEANSWGPGNRNSAAQAAKETFREFKLEVFGIQAELELNDDHPNVGPGEYLMIGAYAKFKRKMDIIGRVTGQTELELISESFLGREPTRGVCASRVCKAITGLDACDGTMDITLYDNGC